MEFCSVYEDERINLDIKDNIVTPLLRLININSFKKIINF
jgi:hypothetical protein